jgi:hypothetical protein
MLNKASVTKPLKKLLEIPVGISLRQEAPGAAKRLLRHPATSLLRGLRSTERFCVFCNQKVRLWVPYIIRTSDLSDFLREAEITH